MEQLEARLIVWQASWTALFTTALERGADTQLWCVWFEAIQVPVLTSGAADTIVKVPQMAESITEGTLKHWSKRECFNITFWMYLLADLP
jgi:hypothetical protein